MFRLKEPRQITLDYSSTLPPTSEAAPKPRLIDTLLELYIRIGGYISVTLSLCIFLGICALSYRMFFGIGIVKMHILFKILYVTITMIAAVMAAAGIFLWTAVMWLPILLALCFLWIEVPPLLARWHL